jgi:hypothetical protein
VLLFVLLLLPLLQLFCRAVGVGTVVVIIIDVVVIDVATRARWIRHHHHHHHRGRYCTDVTKQHRVVWASSQIDIGREQPASFYRLELVY